MGEGRSRGKQPSTERQNKADLEREKLRERYRVESQPGQKTGALECPNLCQRKRKNFRNSKKKKKDHQSGWDEEGDEVKEEEPV